ncbi:MAG: hypothetical protein OEV66_07755 [Spirochaetia bacterium]|nr:hypothetical protein [Spirochaetia bacterium]
MNRKYFLPLFLIFFSGTALVLFSAEKGNITIVSPANKYVVNSNMETLIVYTANPGKRGDHLRLVTDGNDTAILNEMKGIAEVGSLSAGVHKVCLVIDTKPGMSTGVENCVEVIVH